jgi:nitronate monooxygenase
VKGNYLRGSVVRTGFDPDNLPEADKSKMNFGSGQHLKEGLARHLERGPGRGQHPRRVADGELVARMVREYEDTRRRLAARPEKRRTTCLGCSI